MVAVSIVLIISGVRFNINTIIILLIIDYFINMIDRRIIYESRYFRKTEGDKNKRYTNS